MFFVQSPLSQFEVTNLIGIFAPIFGQFNIILTNLALYTFLIIIIVITVLELIWTINLALILILFIYFLFLIFKIWPPF